MAVRLEALRPDTRGCLAMTTPMDTRKIASLTGWLMVITYQDGHHGVEAEVPGVRSQLQDREQPGDAPPDLHPTRAAIRGRPRRQSRAGITARASTVTRGRQAKSGRAMPSTKAAAASTPTSSQSSRPTGGASAGRGSCQMERRMVTTGPA